MRINGSNSDSISNKNEELLKKLPSKVIKKSHPKNKRMVALLVEVKFYFSIDDLEEIEEEILNAKELFLSQKRHLVYANNIIGKCFIFKGSYPNIDGFYCTRNYDPVHRRLFRLSDSIK